MNYSLIKTLREEHKISIEALASKIDKTRSGLTRAITNETLSVKDLESIAKTLGVSPCVFFGGKGDINMQPSTNEGCEKCTDKEERIEELRELKDVYKERFEEQKELVLELKEEVKEQKIYLKNYQNTISTFQKRFEDYEDPAGGLSKASS